MIVNRKKSFFCIDFSKYRLITNLGILCLWSLKTHQQDKKCTVLCDWLLWYSCTNSGWIFWSWKSGKLCSWKSLKVLEFLVWNWLWTLYVTPLHHSHLHCELSVSVNIHMSPWLLIDSGCPHWVSYTDDIGRRRPLRSAATNHLIVTSLKLSTVGSRAFLVAASSVWNTLPRKTSSLHPLYSHFSITWKPSCSDVHSRTFICS